MQYIPHGYIADRYFPNNYFAVISGVPTVTHITGIGGTFTAGSALACTIRYYTGAGSVITGGSAFHRMLLSHRVSGSVTITGSATRSYTLTRISSGNAEAGGSAPVTINLNRTGTGSAYTAGTSIAGILRKLTAQGGVVISGSTPGVYLSYRTGTGSVVVTGTGNTQMSHARVSRGGAVVSSAASFRKSLTRTGAGVVEITGNASVPATAKTTRIDSRGVLNEYALRYGIKNEHTPSYAAGDIPDYELSIGSVVNQVILEGIGIQSTALLSVIKWYPGNEITTLDSYITCQVDQSTNITDELSIESNICCLVEDDSIIN